MKQRLGSLFLGIDRYLALICRTGLLAGFLLLIVAVLVQVIGRTIIQSSPVWTEELTRFSLLYMTAFGAGLALRSGDLVNVDLVSESLPGRGPWLLRLVSAISITALCGLLLQPSWRFTAIGALQTSPALGLRMNLVHVTMTVLLALLFAFGLLRILLMLFAGDSGQPRRTSSDSEG